MCLIDAARFPRPKLCGGGITARTEELLACLGVRVTVPAVPITEVRFVFPTGTDSRAGAVSFRVIRREEFDALLVDHVARLGIELRLGDGVVRLGRRDDTVEIELESGTHIGADIVIGADGANSIVRRCTVTDDVRPPPFIALEVLTPGHDAGATNRATFDFRTICEGVRGYAWDFPSLIDGKPFMNRGIAAIGEVPRRALKEVFRDVLAARAVEMDHCKVEGAWAPVYDARRRQSAPRVLLAGDAVGIDPWLGEGISSAIGTGIIAGHVAVEALECGHYDFSGHHDKIASSTVGESLRRSLEIAAAVYPAADGRNHVHSSPRVMVTP